MTLTKIYFMELYKMCKRKINLMLIVPSVLTILIGIGFGSGSLQLSFVGEESNALYTCLDFFMMVWTFIGGTGLYAILMILVSAYQFSGEIEQGQIKMMLLRIGKRSNLIIAKVLALLTLFIGSVVMFMLTYLAVYYFYLVPSGAVSAQFDITYLNLQNYEVFGSVAASLAGFMIFMLLAYVIGVRGNPFMTFIITLVLMFVIKSVAQFESFKIMTYTPFYLENQYMMGGQLEHSLIIGIIITTLLLVMGLFSLTVYRFNKVDIK